MIAIYCIYFLLLSIIFFKSISYNYGCIRSLERNLFRLYSSVEDREKTSKKMNQKPEEYDGAFYNDDSWEGNMEGFDWQLERARRLLEGPAFAPIRMTLWQPSLAKKVAPPSAFDHFKILLNNALQIAGLAESLDGAPLVQGVNTFQGNPLKLLAKVIDGDLAELAGGPLFLLLRDYYKQYGSVFKLAFGPKSFIVVSDPILAKHILKESPQNYDKGILAEILEPVMGKVFPPYSSCLLK
jgi:hypothetical protein